MKAKSVSGIMLTLLLNGMLTLAFNVSSVTANLLVPALTPVQKLIGLNRYVRQLNLDEKGIR